MFDYLVLFVLIASVVISTLRGLVKEILSLVGWVVAFVVANVYGAQLAPLLPEVIPGGSARLMAAFAFGLALLSAAAVRGMIAWPILDHPNARSAHRRPTPRGGGVGVVLAFVLGMLVLYGAADFARIAERQFLGVIAAAVAIAGVALVDDVRSLPARLRLVAQLAAAMVALGSALVLTRLALPWIGVTDLGPVAGVALTLFWILGCTNAVNFMDGLDGLVGGTLAIACGALAAIAAELGGWFVYAASLFLAAGFAGAVAGTFTAAVGYALIRSVESLLGPWAGSPVAVLAGWALLGLVLATLSVLFVPTGTDGLSASGAPDARAVS